MSAKLKNKGFTFIELIIAVTIFSIMAASIYYVLSAGITFCMNANPIIEENQSLRVFFETIATDVKNAVAYYKASTEGTSAVQNFVGESQKVLFMTLIKTSDASGTTYEELAKVSYYYDAGKKAIKKVIAAKDAGFNEASPSAKVFDMVTDLDGKNVGYEYCYKTSSPDTPYMWKSSWSDASKIPRGVRVKVGNLLKTIFIPTGELLESES